MAEPIGKTTIAFEGGSKKQRIVVDNTASALTKAIDPESQVGILFLFAVVTSKSDRGGGAAVRPWTFRRWTLRRSRMRMRRVRQRRCFSKSMTLSCYVICFRAALVLLATIRIRYHIP